MDKETSKTAKHFVKALKKHMNVNRLILFGSRARGDNFITSDYDFIVVSAAFKDKPFIRRASMLYEFWNNDRDLELLCYTPKEWYQLKDQRGILLNAQREGIRFL